MHHLLIVAADNWTNVQHLGDTLGSLWPYAAALGALYAIVKRTFTKTLHDMVETQIKPIQDQFRNNGGSSMRDSVDRIEKVQVEQAATLREHTASDSGNFDSIATTLLSLIRGQQAMHDQIDLNSADIIEKQVTAATGVKSDLDTAAQDIKSNLDTAASTIKADLDAAAAKLTQTHDVTVHVAE